MEASAIAQNCLMDIDKFDGGPFHNNGEKSIQPASYFFAFVCPILGTYWVYYTHLLLDACGSCVVVRSVRIVLH